MSSSSNGLKLNCKVKLHNNQLNNLELKFDYNHLLLLVSPKGSSDKMVEIGD